MKFFLAFILLLVALVFQIRTILLFREMMDEVNGSVPEDSRIPEFGPSWLRGKVIKLHRGLFPASKLRKQMYTSWIVVVTAFTSALACVVRFG
jgi:hypothetical protein